MSKPGPPVFLAVVAGIAPAQPAANCLAVPHLVHPGIHSCPFDRRGERRLEHSDPAGLIHGSSDEAAILLAGRRPRPGETANRLPGASRCRSIRTEPPRVAWMWRVCWGTARHALVAARGEAGVSSQKPDSRYGNDAGKQSEVAVCRHLLIPGPPTHTYLSASTKPAGFSGQDTTPADPCHGAGSPPNQPSAPVRAQPLTVSPRRYRTASPVFDSTHQLRPSSHQSMTRGSQQTPPHPCDARRFCSDRSAPRCARKAVSRFPRPRSAARKQDRGLVRTTVNQPAGSECSNRRSPRRSKGKNGCQDERGEERPGNLQQAGQERCQHERRERPEVLV